MESILTEQLELWKLHQINMQKYVIIEDQSNNFINEIRYIGGVDISFDKKDPNKCCVYLIVIDFNNLSVVYEDHRNEILTIPYISGYLGFREVTHYKNLLEKLKVSKPELYPDVVLVDGFGILHQRGYGSASQLGIECNIPTIGSAKTLLYHDGLDEREIKNIFRNGDIYEYDLKGKSGIVYGRAISVGEIKTNPIFVSVGHKISLDTAINVIKKCSKYRIPEPIRLADIRSKLYFK